MKFKLVNEEALQQRLDAARNGSHEEQKAFLLSLNSEEQSVASYTMMNDDDLRWLKPLADESFLPAMKLVFDGMHGKIRCWEEDFLDEDTNETVTLMRHEMLEDETIFTPDKRFIAQICKNARALAQKLDTEQINQLFWFDRKTSLAARDELDRRDPSRIYNRIYETLAIFYRSGGGEARGIFIDYDKAKTYYERAGHTDFDPKKTANSDRKHAESVFPEFATYRLKGPEANAVTTLLNDLYAKHGEHTEPFMYLPLEVVMKTLVGSEAYVGYIQSIEKSEEIPGAIDIEIEFYDCSTDCLKYALLQAFPEDLSIKVIEHAP